MNKQEFVLSELETLAKGRVLLILFLPVALIVAIVVLRKMGASFTKEDFKNLWWSIKGYKRWR